MPDREKVIKALEHCKDNQYVNDCNECDYGGKTGMFCIRMIDDVLALLKKHKTEYENGFNDAMLGKQELMYEGIDGKWYKKDW